MEVIFPEGLVGCPDWREFVLVPGPTSSPAMRLQCLADESVCFVVVDPRLVEPSYQLVASPEDRRDLEPGDAAPLILCTLSVHGQPPTVTANLLAPLVVNPRTGLARQIVMAESGYSTRHPIGLARPMAGAGQEV